MTQMPYCSGQGFAEATAMVLFYEAGTDQRHSYGVLHQDNGWLHGVAACFGKFCCSRHIHSSMCQQCYSTCHKLAPEHEHNMLDRSRPSSYRFHFTFHLILHYWGDPLYTPIVPLKQIEYGFGYNTIRSPYILSTSWGLYTQSYTPPYFILQEDALGGKNVKGEIQRAVTYRDLVESEGLGFRV